MTLDQPPAPSLAAAKRVSDDKYPAPASNHQLRHHVVVAGSGTGDGHLPMEMRILLSWDGDPLDGRALSANQSKCINCGDLHCSIFWYGI